MRIRIHLLVTAVILSSTMPASATDKQYSQCCPLSCLRVNRADVTEFGADGKSLEISAGSLGRLRISKDTAIDVSEDGELRVCIGYSAFGDPNIKCVQLPAVLM